MRLFRALRRLVRAYLVAVGVIVHLLPILGAYLLIDYYGLSLPYFVQRVFDKAGIEGDWLVALIAPAPAFADHVLDGRPKAAHPRVLLTELAGWDGDGVAPVMARRLAAYAALGQKLPTEPCGGGVFGLTMCWLVRGDAAAGAEAVRILVATKIYTPPTLFEANSAEDYGNAWQVAFGYDLLYNHPAFDDAARATVEARLEKALRRLLLVLDDDSATLWGGRASLAARAWLIAAVLDRGDADREGLRARAQGHFLDVIAALRLTQGWPEGYTQWINARAYPLALAAAAYVNGLDGAKRTTEVVEALRGVGYWTLYATRPDGRVEGLGDEGSRVDLAEETGRVIDLIVQLTRDRVLAAYSRYLQRLRGQRYYYQGYRWSFPLLNDPTVTPAAVIETADLGPLSARLPKARLFGREALGLAVIRSGFGADDTMITFRAGASMTHHGHYDGGHFTLYKGAPLAINSSVGGAFMGANRLDYSIRTVAKNSLLVLRPGERPRPERFATGLAADGGQRAPLATGSAVESVADWRANLGAGLHLEGATVTNADFRDGRHAYIAADLTAAYDTPAYDSAGEGGKVARATRRLLYLADEDILLINDDVTATDAAFTKKWLLHTINRPTLAAARVLVGTTDDGIFESAADRATVVNGRGSLALFRLWPRDAVIHLVGGPDYRFYVESDGDDRVLDGENRIAGASLKPWYDLGQWRIEIQPGAPRRRDRFLIALAPAIGPPRRAAVVAVETEPTLATGAATARSLALFLDPGTGGTLAFRRPGDQRRLYVAGLAKGARARIGDGDGTTVAAEPGDGLAIADLTPLRGAALTLTVTGP